MAKKIIILNGSPRANGNTSALTAEFKRGAEEAGNKAAEFHLSRMKINLIPSGAMVFRSPSSNGTQCGNTREAGSSTVD